MMEQTERREEIMMEKREEERGVWYGDYVGVGGGMWYRDDVGVRCGVEKRCAV